MKGYCTINSDASVNPATGEAGYALWINCDLVTVKIWAPFKNRTWDSNIAEIWSVMNGIHWVMKNKIPVEILVINVDNKCCRDIVNRKKHTYKNEAIERLRIEMQSILDRSFPSYYAKNIRGHMDIKHPRYAVNRWCDEYARKARILKICGKSVNNKAP